MDEELIRVGDILKERHWQQHYMIVNIYDSLELTTGETETYVILWFFHDGSYGKFSLGEIQRAVDSGLDIMVSRLRQ